MASIVDTLTGMKALQPEYTVRLRLDQWVQVSLSLMSSQNHAQMLVNKVAGTSLDNVPLKTVGQLEEIEAAIHTQLRGQIGKAGSSAP